MKTLELPIHPFSKKILLKEYPQMPLRFDAHDLLFQLLSYNRAQRSNLTRLRTILTDNIQISLNDNLAKKLKINGYQFGYHLFCYHIDKMMTFIHSHVLADQTAKSSIIKFYNIYEIGEDDFQLDSAYKRWQRYKTKKIRANSCTNRPPVVLANGNNYQVLIPPDEATLDAIISDYTAAHPELFYTQKNKFSFVFFKQFSIYILHAVGQRKAIDIAKRFKIPLRTVYHNIKIIKDLLSVDVDFKTSLDAYIQQRIQSLRVAA